MITPVIARVRLLGLTVVRNTTSNRTPPRLEVASRSGNVVRVQRVVDPEDFLTPAPGWRERWARRRKRR